MYKIGMISLGCPKNQVDAEIMLAKLEGAGFKIVNDTSGADIVIINTCGFIEDAKREAIECILETVQQKEDGEIKKIIVTGCLAQRYDRKVIEEIPEIDSIIGIGANDDIVKVCRETMDGGSAAYFPPKENLPISGRRLLTTPKYWAYLKIADGCSNNCSYCAIPKIRGRFRSREMQDITGEARTLAASGVKEVIVVAQDTTRYGEDIYGKLMLPALLDKLCEIDGIEWIRLLYCYPERMTDELIKTIARQDKVINYIDLPLQHADGDILAAMNRSGSKQSLAKLIETIRKMIPGVVIRTTFITGFPGETDEKFEILAEFIKEMRFERLGCFAYSAEEETPAASFDDQVDDEKKKYREELIMQEQYGIFMLNNKINVGKILRVLTEGYDAYSDSYYGRSYMDAPEIDGRVVFTSDKIIEPGEFVDVEVMDTIDYDLLGRSVV
ncbi:MAG: 30S ribosomal protein S12 methylthiotransferase RimO [Oscillospiraceae bacterium]|nr:30S ribosomal protein S12 methylthiotransferase RimO [Oscillospiraceae bacterium]